MKDAIDEALKETDLKKYDFGQRMELNSQILYDNTSNNKVDVKSFTETDNSFIKGKDDQLEFADKVEDELSNNNPFNRPSFIDT